MSIIGRVGQQLIGDGETETARRPRPRLGFCDLSPGPSGLSRYLNSVLAGFDPSRYEVVLFAYKGGPYQTSEGVRFVYPIPDGPQDLPEFDPPSPLKQDQKVGRKLRSFWRRHALPGCKLLAGAMAGARRWYKIFRPWGLDFLYVPLCSWEPMLVGARLAGVPRILATYHLDLEATDSSQRLLESLTAHSAHRAIAVSRRTGETWVRKTGVQPRQVTTIHNGVDVVHFRRRLPPRAARSALGVPEDGLLLIGTGRFTPQKGFAYLLEAAAILRREHPTLRVLLAGEGPSQESLQRQAAACGMGDRVHFPGFLKDIRTALEAADVFVLPSLREALPYSLLEAMASQLPVVATTVAGVPEVIVDGECGFLVPPGDAQALAGALRPLLGSAELRRRVGAAALERVTACFDERVMVARTVAEVEAMLAGGRRRRVPEFTDREVCRARLSAAQPPGRHSSRS